MRATHISQQASLVPKVNHEITIISEGNSSDAVISYINFMRHRLNLTPLALDPVLSNKAKRKALALQKKSAILIQSQRAKHHTDKLFVAHKKTYLIPSPITESNQYLECVLNHQCNAVGIYTYEKTKVNKVDSFTIQVFSS